MNSRFWSTAKRLLRHQIAAALMIFAVALGVRWEYVTNMSISGPVRADAAKYATIALNLINHETYSHIQSPSPPTDAFITPGYPMFLSAVLYAHSYNSGKDFLEQTDFDSTYHFVLRAQAILMALNAAIIFLLCALFLPRWAALAGGLLVALSPHLVTISGYLVTEALFTFIACLSIYLVALGVRRHFLSLLLLGAFLIGIGALVRPSYLFFPIVVGTIILLDKRLLLPRRAIYASLVFLFAALAWSPWSIWKADKGSSVDASAASFALGSYPNLTFKNPRLKGRPYKEDPRYEEMSKDLGAAFDVALGRFREDPLQYGYWYLIGKPTTFWSWSIMVGQGGPFIYPVKSSIYSDNSFFKWTLSLFHTIHPVLVLLSLAAAVFLLRELFKTGFNTAPSIEAYVVIGCIAYFTAVHMVFAPLPRYSIPMHPLVFVAGLFAISKWVEIKHKRDAD